MGEGLKRVAKQCGGLTITTKDGTVRYNSEGRVQRLVAVRCSFYIEKDWPGHRSLLWRRQCKNMTKDASGKCKSHR